MRQRWEQVKSVVADALTLPEFERTEYIRTRCLGDEILHREVEALLVAHDSSSGFMEHAAGQVRHLVGEEPKPDSGWMGRRVGAYRLVRLLGEGGMGQVYYAERDDDLFQKQVAIKLVRMAGSHARHFQGERETLARLNHPNIAQLYDGGTVTGPDGKDKLPYLIMELVPGLPIDQYCDLHRLSVRDRIRLFVQVCRAVSFAHQNLVVHSDLKPSNVLVAAPNPDKPAQGEPKLLDFGVAQLVGTHSQGRPLTPQYASPEQVLGRPVTTASDVYSLGLVLYRLVTGSTPYKADATDWPALQRAICSPERLRASAHTPEPGLYADTDVSRELRGDLDAILSKAVARQPAHRYASVDQLRSDLDAWLRGYPISAQPDALTYRAGLFMRRNRWGVGFAAAVFAFALIAAGVIGFQSRRLAVQLAEADAANRYMQSLFDISDPEQVGDSTITVRQLLDAGLEQAQATFGDRPERMSTVLNVLGPLYEKRGWYREAIRVNDLAVQQLETSGAADQMELASSYKFLASSHHAWGDYDEAEGLYRRALELLRGVLGPDDPRVADAMNDLALLLYDNGATDEAEVLTRRALATREQAAVPAQDVAESLNLLGLIVQAGGDEQAALAAYTRSLQLRRRTLGERHLKTAATMNNLALLHKEYGRLGEAEALMSQVLDIERAALGEAHPSVATSLNNYGRLLRSMGHLDEAERVYRDALAIRQEYFGSQHQAVATSLNNLAFLLQHKGQPAQAVPLYEQAIEAWHSASGATHPDVAVGHHNLARLLRDEQQFAEAQRHYERAAGIYERHLPETHVDLASVLVGLGKLHLLAGQPVDAIPALRRAHELRRMHLGLDDWRPYSAQSLLGEAMHSVGGSSAGRSHLVAGYEGLRRVLGADDRRTQEAKARLRQ